jgi:hypothetical protein
VRGPRSPPRPLLRNIRTPALVRVALPGHGGSVEAAGGVGSPPGSAPALVAWCGGSVEAAGGVGSSAGSAPALVAWCGGSVEAAGGVGSPPGSAPALVAWCGGSVEAAGGVGSSPGSAPASIPGPGRRTGFPVSGCQARGTLSGYRTGNARAGDALSGRLTGNALPGCRTRGTSPRTGAAAADRGPAVGATGPRGRVRARFGRAMTAGVAVPGRCVRAARAVLGHRGEVRACGFRVRLRTVRADHPGRRNRRGCGDDTRRHRRLRLDHARRGWRRGLADNLRRYGRLSPPHHTRPAVTGDLFRARDLAALLRGGRYVHTLAGAGTRPVPSTEIHGRFGGGVRRTALPGYEPRHRREPASAPLRAFLLASAGLLASRTVLPGGCGSTRSG